MQVKTERGVLPEDHPERVTTRLGLAISALEREDSAAATSILEAYMDDEEERIHKVCKACHPCCTALLLYLPTVQKSSNGGLVFFSRSLLLFALLRPQDRHHQCPPVRQKPAAQQLCSTFLMLPACRKGTEKARLEAAWACARLGSWIRSSRGNSRGFPRMLERHLQWPIFWTRCTLSGRRGV